MRARPESSRKKAARSHRRGKETADRRAGERARKRERADGLAEGVMHVVADAPAMRIHFEDLAGGIGEVEDDFEGA